jgi:probable F420-dependent oxidoreductase
MRFGFHAINLGPLASPAAVRQVLAACERYRIDSIWTGDHVINAFQIDSTYPYSPTGKFPLPPEEPILEPLTFMGYAVAQTQTVQVGVSVLIVPYRNPVVTARALGALDYLSEGRIIVGVGSGWMKEEFDALGVPFEDRGARTDEFIHIFKEIWTNPTPRFSGAYSQFSGITAYPLPVQKPHPPIWVGGNSKRAMRRALELGDGWQPGWSKPEQFAQEMQDFQRIADRLGRDPKTVEISLLRPMQIIDRTDAHRPLIGAPEQIAEDIRAYQRLGVSHLVFAFRTRVLAETLETIERFATQIRPLLQ